MTLLASAFYFQSWSEPGRRIAQNLSMSNTQRFDPALLSQGKRDKKAELNQLFGGKVLMQLLPQCLVSNF